MSETLPADSQERLDIWQHQVPLYAQPNDGCVLASLRSAIAYYEPSDIPDWPELAEATNKQDGEGVMAHEFALHLLKRGFEVVVYTDFDEARVKREGIRYLEEYYSVNTPDSAWKPEDFYGYFTPEYMANYLSEIDSVAARFAQYPRFSEVLERPTLETIKALLPDYLVHVEFGQLEGSDDISGHSVLVIGCQDFEDGEGQFLLTSQAVEPAEPLVTVMPYGSFIEEWMPDEGIYAIRKQ